MGVGGEIIGKGNGKSDAQIGETQCEIRNQSETISSPIGWFYSVAYLAGHFAYRSSASWQWREKEEKASPTSGLRLGVRDSGRSEGGAAEERPPRTSHALTRSLTHSLAHSLTHSLPE